MGIAGSPASWNLVFVNFCVFPYLLSATHQRTSATAHAPVSANTLDLAVQPEVTRQPGGTRNAALRTR